MGVEVNDDDLAVLFERAPCSSSADDELPAGDRLDRAEEVALSMPEAEQVELLNAHPRIGAAPGSVSALSFREQGYDRDAGHGRTASTPRSSSTTSTNAASAFASWSSWPAGRAR